MNGFKRIRSRLPLLLLVCVVLLPTMTEAQTSRERREQEIQAQLARMEALQEARLAEVNEALIRAKAELAAQESQTQEQLVARLARIEEALVQARAQVREVDTEAQARRQEALIQQELRAREALAQAQHRVQLEQAQQERVLAQELGARERALSRVRERDQEVRYRVREALARAEEGQERARQLRIQVRSRVRLGVSLDGGQDEELDRQGARIQSVMEDSPAEAAGLEDGDIITHLDGHSLLEPLEAEKEEGLDEDESLPVQRLIALAQDLEDGQEVDVRYLRDGAARTAVLEAAEIDEPNVIVLRGDRGDMLRRGVVRIDPDDENVWTFSGPDQKVLSLRLSELGELENLEGLEDIAVELKALKNLDELSVKLEALEADPNVITLRAAPGTRGGAVALRSHGTPRVLQLSRGSMGLGLQTTELNSALGEYFSAEYGVLVLEVDEDSPMNLEPGDVITAVDRREVTSERALWRILGSYEADENFTLTVVRKGQTMEVEGSGG